MINGKDASKFGSSGQQRGVVLALKLAEIDLFRADRDDFPVFLLDDIDAELDPKRLEELFALISSGVQIVATTSKPGVLDDIAFKGAHRKFTLKLGNIDKIE